MRDYLFRNTDSIPSIPSQEFFFKAVLVSWTDYRVIFDAITPDSAVCRDSRDLPKSDVRELAPLRFDNSLSEDATKVL
jgi:hypothetical protein